MYSKYILTESEKNYKSDISYLVVTVCSIKYKDPLRLTQEDFLQENFKSDMNMKATFFLKRPENFEVLESCVHNTHVTQLIWKNETAQVYSFLTTCTEACVGR